MRGHRPVQPSFVSLINVEALIPASHPVRVIKRMCDEILAGMDEVFDEIYAAAGAPSVPPETLLKGKVLQALYSVRSDRQLCARLQTDLLFRWFVDLPLEAAVFDAVTGASGGPAHSDLAQATRIALSMETSLGLGADHPLVHRDVDLAGHLLLRDRDLLDRVDARLQAAMGMAQHIVEAHRDRLLRLAAALATSGTLDAGEIASILDTRDSTRPSIPESSG